jgi:AcrR family transcriptional regulator
MEQEEKDQSTAEIFYSALKNKMKEKSLDRITVTELSDMTGINRQTFYYHFADVEDLVAKMFQHDLRLAMEDTKPKDNPQDAFMRIFKYCMDNKDLIFAAINSAKSGGLEYYTGKEIQSVLLDYVRERENFLQTQLTDEDEDFLASFYKYPFAGEALAWIKGGMRSDLIDKLGKMVMLISMDLDQDILKIAESEKTKK